MRRHRDLGRLRQGRSACRSTESGARSPTRSRSASSAATTTSPTRNRHRARSYVAAGFAGCKFKVGGRSPAEDAARVRVAREATRPVLALMVDANQGYTRAQAVEFARLLGDLDLRWFEEPCRWTERSPLDARRPLPDGHPGLRRSERVHAWRACATSSWTARSTSATSTPRGPAVRPSGARRPGCVPRSASRWVTTKSRRSAAHLLASVPDHTFVECFDEERDPFFWRLTDLSTRFLATDVSTCRSGRASGWSWTGTTCGPTPSRRASRVDARSG